MIIRFYEYKRLIMHGSRPVTPVESSQQICKDLFDALFLNVSLAVRSITPPTCTP